MECVRLVAALRSLCVPSALAASLDRESQSGDQSHALHKPGSASCLPRARATPLADVAKSARTSPASSLREVVCRAPLANGKRAARALVTHTYYCNVKSCLDKQVAMPYIHAVINNN